jgi:hypothetical protein
MGGSPGRQPEFYYRKYRKQKQLKILVIFLTEAIGHGSNAKALLAELMKFFKDNPGWEALC